MRKNGNTGRNKGYFERVEKRDRGEIQGRNHMKRDASLYLKDILEAMESIEKFVKDMTLEEFRLDNKTSSAVISLQQENSYLIMMKELGRMRSVQRNPLGLKK